MAGALGASAAKAAAVKMQDRARMGRMIMAGLNEPRRWLLASAVGKQKHPPKFESANAPEVGTQR